MRRTFTVDQANLTLPYVRRIVEDIVRTYEQWQERVREFEVVAAAGTPTSAASSRAEELQRDVQGLAADIDRYSAELEQVGARIEGYDHGRVDFPAEVEGRPVYLCWRLGEPSVQFWHEVDTGFDARRPVQHTARRAG
ncbi:MAG TPA: DUF2203 domain-containing protein [Gemmatimonadaceae bacterium]